MNFLKSKSTYLLLVLTLSTSSSFAQLNAQEQAVMKPIEALFEGMKKADTAMVIGAFAEKVSLMTAYLTKEGESKVHHGKLEDFIKAIAEKPTDSPLWLETIANPKIQVDDHLAHVWVDYTFKLDEKFSHCGVNSFQLVKLKGEWKIVQLIDTRRKDNCN